MSVTSKRPPADTYYDAGTETFYFISSHALRGLVFEQHWRSRHDEFIQEPHVIYDFQHVQYLPTLRPEYLDEVPF